MLYYCVQEGLFYDGVEVPPAIDHQPVQVSLSMLVCISGVQLYLFYNRHNFPYYRRLNSMVLLPYWLFRHLPLTWDIFSLSYSHLDHPVVKQIM